MIFRCLFSFEKAEKAKRMITMSKDRQVKVITGVIRAIMVMVDSFICPDFIFEVTSKGFINKGLFIYNQRPRPKIARIRIEPTYLHV